MRQIVLDTETTGLEPSQGHRIIEIGCVEIVNRRLTGKRFHQYLQPDRQIDEGALNVHGISNEFLEDKPRFSEVADEFIEFIEGAELVIHNAPFDVGFINAEFIRLKRAGLEVASLCGVVDTLVLARKMHPGQKNNLDALCKRYEINNAHRELHGALLDAEILAEVYLTMTGGQSSLVLDTIESEDVSSTEFVESRVSQDRPGLRVIKASEQEMVSHAAVLQRLEKSADGGCVWNRVDTEVE